MVHNSPKNHKLVHNSPKNHEMVISRKFHSNLIILSNLKNLKKPKNTQNGQNKFYLDFGHVWANFGHAGQDLAKIIKMVHNSPKNYEMIIS